MTIIGRWYRWVVVGRVTTGTRLTTGRAISGSNLHLKRITLQGLKIGKSNFNLVKSLVERPEPGCNW